ncbi:hypothetical protein LPJ66_012191, partial [Kickxella alabastrina]
IEKSIDMISMQCKMIANMLRRSRDASGMALDSRQDTGTPDGGEAVEMLNSAMSSLSSTMRHVSGEYSEPTSASRKRPRIRPYGDDQYALGRMDAMASHTTPPAVKRRGRPPRDYGDELGPAFAMYASEVFGKTAQAMHERASKTEVLRAVWDSWWLSAQGLKDKYLALARHETVVNETNMLEMLVDYPLPSDAAAIQASHRQPPFSAHSQHQHQPHYHSQQPYQSQPQPQAQLPMPQRHQSHDQAQGNARLPMHLQPHSHSESHSPEPEADAFDAFLREQIPLLRSKVPDWSEAEIHRRLT